jgi:hypothetical protein
MKYILDRTHHWKWDIIPKNEYNWEVNTIELELKIKWIIKKVNISVSNTMKLAFDVNHENAKKWYAEQIAKIIDLNSIGDNNLIKVLENGFKEKAA